MINPDASRYFNEDYHYFTSRLHDNNLNEKDVDLICAILDIKPNMDLLDIGCGYGRISNLLARKGIHVVGIDNNKKYLEYAINAAEALGVKVSYRIGDMRNLELYDSFDRVLLWFNSFGYFPDIENNLVLTGAFNVLRKGGFLLLDLMNRDGVVSSLPRDYVLELGNNLEIHRHRFDSVTSNLIADRIVVINGEVRRSSYVIRLYTFAEVKQNLLNSGFNEVRVYGNLNEPFTSRSGRMLIVANK